MSPAQIKAWLTFTIYFYFIFAECLDCDLRALLLKAEIYFPRDDIHIGFN